jgi:hypothetical protein
MTTPKDQRYYEPQSAKVLMDEFPGWQVWKGVSAPGPTPKSAAPVLHLRSADQGVVCAGVNAMVFTGTSKPFATEAGATAFKFGVSAAKAAPAIAAAIRARCSKYDSIIPHGE